MENTWMRKLALSILACATATAVWAKPREINADFVGGCGTMREATAYSLSASTNLAAYPIQALNDGKLNTCWVCLDGPGHWFDVSPKGDGGAIFYCGGFTIANGHCKSLEDYRANNRVRRGRVEVEGQVIKHVDFHDRFEDQMVTFSPAVRVAKGQSLRFVVESVYPGTTYSDCCISEFQYSNGRH